MIGGLLRPRRARLVLLLLAGTCVVCLARLDLRSRISTQVLDLIPAAERVPELGAVRDLADNLQARVVLITVRPESAARAFSSRLRHSPHFADVQLIGSGAGAEDLGRGLVRERMTLLLPGWLAEQERAFAQAKRPPSEYDAWVAERAAVRLETYLERPEAMPLQQLLPFDPLLLVARLLDHAHTLLPSASSQGVGLVWARSTSSPLVEAGQKPVADAVEAAAAAVRSTTPDLQVQWTGVGRFAAASRAQIEHEIRTLNAWSLVAVAAVGMLCLRRIWQLAHLIPVVLGSMLGAWTASLLAFPRVHILVFAIGSILAGVAIDYGFYIFLQPYASPEEDYPGKLRRLRRPLLASCLTTVAGFLLLLASDLPLIRQMGWFVAAGLLAALVTAILYFAQLGRPLLAERRWPAFVSRWRVPRRTAVALATAALLIAAVAPWRLHWKDDVHELDLPQPELQTNDEQVRKAFGETEDRSAYLTSGANPAEARRHLELFLRHVGRVRPETEPLSLGLILPTPEDLQAQPARLRALEGFPAAFRGALLRRGFLPEAFAPFFNAWEAAARTPAIDFAVADRAVDSLLTGPLRMLAAPAPEGRSWFVTLIDAPVPEPWPADAHTVSAREVQHLNALFTRYRWSALRLSMVGLAIVIGSVFLLYPPKRAVRIALIPAGSCLFVFGALGLAGQTLNLFHLLGAFLGVCLAHNYSIFSSATAAAGEPPPLAVRLSALCASASFGVLATSHIPVVHALGLTVFLIVLVALAVVEIEGRVRA